jgi:hypothetical protein
MLCQGKTPHKPPFLFFFKRKGKGEGMVLWFLHRGDSIFPTNKGGQTIAKSAVL